jgi:hypothetical protein
MWQQAALAFLVLAACSVPLMAAAHPSAKSIQRRAVRAGVHKSPVVAHALRMRKGDDLVTTLTSYCARHALTATSISSCVGSLSAVRLRLAGADEFLELQEPLEIVSLVGTVAKAGESFHLHASVSRRDGSVVGGHIKGAAPVATTAELVLTELPEVTFTREPDPATGYAELVIRTGAAADGRKFASMRSW